MHIRKKIARPLVVLLAVSQCMTSFAGTWTSKTPTQWVYQNDDGTYRTGGWFQDPADSRWYYLDDDGVMSFGWKLIDNVWYFFNTVHDGTFGAMLSGSWQWIDGYCYLFDADGKMYAGTTTPDGFVVNQDGKWTENGTVVYMEGKGIITAAGPGQSAAGNISANTPRPGGSSSGGGGGGSSGGGGGSVSYSYYDYTIVYVDEQGNVLASITGEGRKNTFITVVQKVFDGYVYTNGQEGAQKLTSDGMVFTMHYKKEVSEEPKPEEPSEEEKEEYSYEIRYVDSDTDETIKTVKGKGSPGQVIAAETSLNGYSPDEGNQYSFTLSENNMELTLYYTKKKAEFKYEIRYMGDDGKQLGFMNGIGKEGDLIEIPEKEFEGYTLMDSSKTEFVLSSNNQIVKVLYQKDEIEDVATPSEPAETLLSYTIKYLDKDSSDEIGKEGGSVIAGETVIPSLVFEGYEYATEYEFLVEEDHTTFIVYLIRNEILPEEKEVPYTVSCVDENGNVLKVFEGKVTVTNDESVAITPDYVIDGYERISDNEFIVDPWSENYFTLEYAKLKEYTFRVECWDIAENVLVDTIILDGDMGEELDISDICPVGYEKIGQPPSTVIVSGNSSNNYIKIYYRKIKEIPEVTKEARYTIQFRAYKDHKTQILNDVTGVWNVGENIPVYFIKELTDRQGRIWRAIGDSPRTFRVQDQEMNTFVIEYQQVGDIEKPDMERVYTIRYIAEDTKSVLGITTGIGFVGDIIPYRNSFNDYGFIDHENAYTITEDEDNTIDVTLQRVSYPGHEKNPNTGLYDGFEWLALFVDSNGNQLLPNVSGFTVKGDDMYFDYPDIIEEDGVTYRATKASPFKHLASGTVYQQFVIQYVTGDPSETKLEMWKNKAQEKKDEFHGTTPYSYYVAYREKNSWNDIGLKFGVANAGSEVMIECEKMDGWIVPSENLGGFVLDKDGKTVLAQYERLNDGTSLGYNEREYTIHFADTEGNDLFAPYEGKLAFVKGNSKTDFKVYYPNTFYDAEGNRWEADVQSPSSFVMSAMDKNEKTVSYHQVYENEKEQFVVTSGADVNRILNEFAIFTKDSKRHEFYLIGKDYIPNHAEVSDTMYINNLAGYSNEVVDSFVLDGVTYTISLVSYYHKWDPITCTHNWAYEEDLKGNCLTSARRTVQCDKCGKEVVTIYPAVGHTDENYDGVCDVCGVRLKQNLGDQITVMWNSGALGFGSRNYNFICVDTDYQGTGKMLYLCEDDIGPEIYGGYNSTDTADYYSSDLRDFLDDEFANGLSVYAALQSIEGDAVSMLTKEEYDAYKAASKNQFLFPSGTFLTKNRDMDLVTLTNGVTVTKEEAGNYPIRPVILLNRSEEEEGIRSGIWKEGDMQAREIGGKLYLFRCVDSNYTDKSNTDKSLALFLCDTVIPSNAGLGFDEAGGTQSTRFFGENNNYKYSVINEWLSDNKSKTGNLISTNIGIINEYAGTTGVGQFQSLDVNDLKRYPRSKEQVMYSNLFIPSVEEAVSMKDYLWKFNGSDKNNAKEVINNYCESYWLRTPQYGTNDMIYTVNLRTGVIEPKPVKATAGNDVSDTGIRPMYIVEQAY